MTSLRVSERSTVFVRTERPVASSKRSAISARVRSHCASTISAIKQVVGLRERAGGAGGGDGRRDGAGGAVALEQALDGGDVDGEALGDGGLRGRAGARRVEDATAEVERERSGHGNR